MERIVYNPDKIESWTHNNVGVIYGAMEAQIMQCLRFTQTYGRQDREAEINNKLRTRSEMPICWALGKIPPPEGYWYEEGKVGDIDHAFYMNQFGEIVCLTAPQFYQPRNNTLSRGKRTERYALQAPDIFFIVSPEIAVLYGTVNQIRDRLGLEYTTAD